MIKITPSSDIAITRRKVFCDELELAAVDFERSLFVVAARDVLKSATMPSRSTMNDRFVHPYNCTKHLKLHGRY